LTTTKIMKIFLGLFLVHFGASQGANTFLNITNILLSGMENGKTY